MGYINENFAFQRIHEKYFWEIIVDLPDIVKEALAAQQVEVEQRLHVRVRKVDIPNAFEIKMKLYKDSYLNKIRFFQLGITGDNYLRNVDFTITSREFAGSVNLADIWTTWRSVIENPFDNSVMLDPSVYVGQFKIIEYAPYDEDEIIRQWQAVDVVPISFEYGGYNDEWEHDTDGNKFVDTIVQKFKARKLIEI